jgi:nucleotide-binding universal stress UspA family protein
MNILVATDLSDDGDVAIDVARAFRARHGGTITIAHVASKKLETDLHVPEDLSDAELIVELGKPAEKLLAIAASRKTDLIVLGGRAPSGKRVFGSVAEAVLTATTVPVLIARQHPETGEVIATSDLTDVTAVLAAIKLAQPTHARVTVVHVRAHDPTAEEKVVLKRIKRELPPTGKVQIERGDPAAAIVAVAERHNAELIVVATRGRKGLARVIIGSVASAVVRRASCSVLVVPVAR